MMVLVVLLILVAYLVVTLVILVTDGDDAEESLAVNWVSNGGIHGD